MAGFTIITWNTGSNMAIIVMITNQIIVSPLHSIFRLFDSLHHPNHGLHLYFRSTTSINESAASAHG